MGAEGIIFHGVVVSAEMKGYSQSSAKNTHAHVSGIKLPGTISEDRKLSIGVSGTRIDVLDSNNVVDVETCAVLPIGSWRYPSVACTTPVAGR